MSLSAVLYTRNGSTLSSILSGSQSLTQIVQSNSTSSLNGPHGIAMSWGNSTVLSPGEYWVAIHVSTNNTATGGAATTALGRSVTMFVGAQPATAVVQLAPFGSTTASTQGASIGLGIISTGQTLATLPFNSITQNSTAMQAAKLWADFRNYSLW